MNESRLLLGVQGILGDIQSTPALEPKLVSRTSPSFGCSRGYRLSSDGEGCGESVSDVCSVSLLLQPTDTDSAPVSVSTVICPAGTLSRDGACRLCPQGTYQDEEGRDFCNKCPRGSSPAGASSVNQCVSSDVMQNVLCEVKVLQYCLPHVGTAVTVLCRVPE